MFPRVAVHPTSESVKSVGSFPTLTYTSYFVSLRFISILHFHLCLGLANSLPFRLSGQNFVCISHLVRAACSADLVILEFIALIMFGEYKL